MLYKKLYWIPIAVYASLTSSNYGATNYSVSSNPGFDFTYPGSQSTLHIYCDAIDAATNSQFNCGAANECYFHCEEKQCAASATVRAPNSNNLYIEAGDNGQLCFSRSTIYTPDNGNAYFTSTAKRGFKEMVIISGNNTQNININCDSLNSDQRDDCKDMSVYASTAKYLKITVANSNELTGAYIACPNNSTYNGPDVAPCIIDATDGILTDVTIMAFDGIPKNVYVNVTASSATNVQIHCDYIGGGGLTSTFPFGINSDCWWTKDPTNDPTTDPTNNPTKDPTPAPTKQPSPSPTKHPTPSSPNDPTNNPSLQPTANPFKANQSNNPSLDPTYNPSQTPSNYPSTNPSAPPTLSSSETTQSSTSIDGDATTTESAGKVMNDETTETTANPITEGFEGQETSTDDNILIIVAMAVSIFVLLVCVAFVAQIYRTKRALKKQTTNKEMQHVIQLSTMTGIDNVAEKNDDEGNDEELYDKVETNKGDDASDNEEMYINEVISTPIGDTEGMDNSKDMDTNMEDDDSTEEMFMKQQLDQEEQLTPTTKDDIEHNEDIQIANKNDTDNGATP